jgi:hypothetical protein
VIQRNRENLYMTCLIPLLASLRTSTGFGDASAAMFLFAITM